MTTTEIICFVVIIIMILIIIYLSANYWKNKEALGVSRSKNNSNYRRDEIQRLSLSMSKEKVDLEKKLIKDISDLKIKHEKDISNLKEDFRKNSDDEYQKGFDAGKNSVDFKIHVSPVKEEFYDKGFFSKTKKISIGYSYRLYVNGIPCLDPHKEWIQTLDVKEINEENVKYAVDKIESIIEVLPVSKVKVVKNLADFKRGIKKTKP
ncbi:MULTISPECIES: hypothetical protein [Croceibacter]|uniref:hypothetical protein n=1 Tax=Croceibacter TaxID=216431 RepID=UPI00235684BF|nr:MULTISPECIES: hypothetical protein [Croceibacter]